MRHRFFRQILQFEMWSVCVMLCVLCTVYDHLDVHWNDELSNFFGANTNNYLPKTNEIIFLLYFVILAKTFHFISNFIQNTLVKCLYNFLHFFFKKKIAKVEFGCTHAFSDNDEIISIFLNSIENFNLKWKFFQQNVVIICF